MSWRETFAARFGPGLFLGMTFGDWWKTLRQNGFAVDRPYWGRAAVTTFCSLQNSLLRWCENALYGRRILQAQSNPPYSFLASGGAARLICTNCLRLTTALPIPTSTRRSIRTRFSVPRS